MTIHTSPFEPITLRDKTITEIVFEGLQNRGDVPLFVETRLSGVAWWEVMRRP